MKTATEKFIAHYNNAPFALDKIKYIGGDITHHIENNALNACEAGVPRARVTAWELKAMKLFNKLDVD